MSDIRTKSKKKRALTLLNQGRQKEAADLLQEITRIDPRDAEAWFRLGAIYGENRLGPQAETCFKQVVALRPDMVHGHFNLALALALQDKNAEAIEYYRQALELKPDFLEAIHNLGLALGHEARFEDAQAVLAQGLALYPNHSKLLSSRAEILERQGEHQKAYETLKPLVDGSMPPTVEAALTFGKICKHVKACPQAIAMHKQLLENGAVPLIDAERMYLHFSLGRLLDAAGEYDAAFIHSSTANKMKQRRLDAQQLSKRFESYRTTYTKEFLSRAPRATLPSSHLTFIVGVPRSGTSLVEQILSSHSGVKGMGEIMLLPNLIQSLPTAMDSRLPYPQCITELTQATADDLANVYHQQVKALVGEPRRVTDKMLQNFEHLGLIALLFPEARVIHCMRDPLDTCLSCYFMHFRSDSMSQTYDLTDLGIYYREYRQLMAHWRTVLDIPFMEIQYEELIDDQERYTRELLAFCDLPWEDDCLQFHETGRAVVTASYDQVRRPLYRSSVGRWKHYAQHLDPLRKALKEG